VERLSIGVLGFGNIARTILDKIKRFPEYGMADNGSHEVHVHMVHVNRETFSFGPNLVVPIKDAEGNGSRTYKDGLEAIRRYETTVSFFEDWLLEHVAEDGDLNTVIDCTSYNEESVALIFKVLHEAKKGLRFYTVNKKLIENHLPELLDAAKEHSVEFKYHYVECTEVEEVANAVISDLRVSLDGGKPWTPVQFSTEFMDEAKTLSVQAAKEMAEVYEKQKEQIVANRHKEDFEYNPRHIYCSTVFQDYDYKIIDRFIVNGEGDYIRTETYDNFEKCRVIEHEMLHWYYGAYLAEPNGARFFLDSKLRVSTAKLFIYDSDESIASRNKLKNDCKYAIKIMVESQGAWVRVFEDLPYNIVLSGGEMIAYSQESGPTYRERMGLTENKEVKIIMFHLAETDSEGRTPECTCYDL
tara:strand:- start:1735 stop:2973 length:1239 start_codon:yes stop_codon:yes gene_type:complete